MPILPKPQVFVVVVFVLFFGLKSLDWSCSSWILAEVELSCMMFAGLNLIHSPHPICCFPLYLICAPSLIPEVLIGFTSYVESNDPFIFLSVMMAKEKPPITVVGDVGGRIAIIVVRLSTFFFDVFCIIVKYLLCAESIFLTKQLYCKI